MKWRAIRKIAGLPNSHWLWGDLWTVKEIFDKQEEAQKYRDYVIDNRIKLIKGWLGPFYPVLNVEHCSLVPEVLKLPKCREVYDTLKPWLGDGLLVSQGNKWFRNRRLLTPAFHYEILAPYVQVYNKSFESLLEKWSVSAKTHDPVCLFDSLGLLSLDIVLQCSFSFSSNCQRVGEVHPYIKTVQDLVHMTTQRYIWPPYSLDWYYFLTPTGRKYSRLCRQAHDYSRMVIQSRKKELEISGNNQSMSESELKAKKKGKYLDFLDVLLIARDDEGNGLTDQEIQAEVDTFLFEGHDTTTSGMCWTLFWLAKHPEHQERVREEVRSVLMGREWLEHDDLKELKYTLWCFKEAIRMCPPVFRISRETTEPIQLDGHEIPKGTRVGIDIHSVHYNDPWKNAKEFDPLRFHPSNCEGRHPYAYIPFSGGQRNCIGQNFALNEARVVIASIVNRFKLSLVEGHIVESAPFVVLRTKYDIKVNLEPVS